MLLTAEGTSLLKEAKDEASNKKVCTYLTKNVLKHTGGFLSFGQCIQQMVSVILILLNVVLQILMKSQKKFLFPDMPITDAAGQLLEVNVMMIFYVILLLYIGYG